MRLHILGVNVKERWESIADIVAKRTKERLRPFNDLHFLMALAMSERFDKATKFFLQ